MKNVAKAIAGSTGGRARIRRHGNPGTKEGRRLGGLRSQAMHTKLRSRFQILQEIKHPGYTEQFAELMGILAGDGHVGLYQVSVTTNATTDIKHAYYVRDLLHTLFGRPVSVTKRTHANAVVVLLSSKAASDFLQLRGMTRGNKVIQQIRPPKWVLDTKSFKKAYLRGLIDTDGTVYKDKHHIKGKHYVSLCIAFTNASIPLLNFVEDTLIELGYHPTRSGRNVRLRRRKDVADYVKTIGFNNAKHSKRIGV